MWRLSAGLLKTWSAFIQPCVTKKIGAWYKSKEAYFMTHKKRQALLSFSATSSMNTRPVCFPSQGNSLMCVISICNWNTSKVRVCVYLKSVLNSAHSCDLGCTPVFEAARCAQRFPTFYIWFHISAPLRWVRWSLNERSVEPWCCPISPLAQLRQPSPSPQHRLARCHPCLLNSWVISSPAGLPHMEPHFCCGFLISAQRLARLWLFLSFYIWFWSWLSARRDEWAFDALICSFNG